MINNYILFEQEKRASATLIYETVTLELERFADSVEIEATSSNGDNVHIKLDTEQVKQIAEFLGGFIGMLSA